MAWTALRTWTADQVVLASELNVDVRDNMNVLDQHDHSGGSGQGTRALGGSGTGLTVVYLRDGAGPGTPTGTISALFTTGSRLAMHSSGGTVVLFATSGHEHGVTQVQIVQSNPTGATAYTSTLGTMLFYRGPFATADQVGTLSTNLALGGTGRRSVAVTGGFHVFKEAGASGTWHLRIFRDGSTLASGAFTTPLVAGTAQGILVSTGTVDPTLASGTYAYSITINATGANTNTFFIAGAFVSAQEVSVP